MDRVDHQQIIVQDLVNLSKNKELKLNPWYQRRSVWTVPQKSYLINTLFENKPVPSIYIRHSLDIENETSVREVVDGQQRIRAILEYIEDGYPAKHPSYNKKILFSKLNRAQRQHFLLTGLSVGFLLGATDEDVIEIFGRLNSVAKSLNAQEKRNAKFSGEYKQFCLRQAVRRLSLWRNLRIFTANDIARMSEVQFISDLTLNFLNGLSDYSSQKLDKVYEQFDEQFQRASEMESIMEEVFIKIASLKPEVIKDTVFRRQPLFFSLCYVLGSSNRKTALDAIENTAYKIDEILNSDTPVAQRPKDDVEFYNACSASTQRIKQRRIRDNFIKNYLL
ncbi:MAG: DUF262 domain-containing protein [Proteobacteria bacterium]|nr:DUF262 domain-containing protein [Pseudomonadota bacterium]MBU4603329.1 DUF262 domain-containing protein [Pseudomonadota bacterium]MCG2766401.1 DUF262 domain-containing protein [Desulfarculaceae bacterium]